MFIIPNVMFTWNLYYLTTSILGFFPSSLMCYIVDGINWTCAQKLQYQHLLPLSEFGVSSVPREAVSR